MDPDTTPPDKPAPPAAPPALAKGEPGGGVASALAAPPEPPPGAEPAAPAEPGLPPDPPPAPRFPWLARLSPRARSVLRVLLATLALGWWTQRAMHRHFDAGPYTGPLYRFELPYGGGDDRPVGLMDDTGRIVVPAGKYQSLVPIGGWRSAWIGVGTRRRLAWSTSKRYLSMRTYPSTPVIVQAGAASRSLGIEVPKIPLLTGHGVRAKDMVYPGAYRPAQHPELLELYRDPSMGILIGHNPEPHYKLLGVRLTEGPMLLHGARNFRLSLSPPTYLVGDDAGATIQRWDGEGFVEIATLPGPAPHEVSVLSTSPLTFLVRESYLALAPALPANPQGDLCIYRIVGDRLETLGRYLSVEGLSSRTLTTTGQVTQIYGREPSDSALDYLAAFKAGPEGTDTPDAKRHMLLSPAGDELCEGRATTYFTTSEHFIIVRSLDGGGYLVVRATGDVYPYQRVYPIESLQTIIGFQLHDGSKQVIDSQGRVLSSSPPTEPGTDAAGWIGIGKESRVWSAPAPNHTGQTTVYGGDPLRGHTARRTDQALRVYDHANQLLFELPGDWRVQIRRLAWDLFELRPARRLPDAPARYLVHADGSPAPDDGQGILEWLDGTAVTITYPTHQIGLRTADKEQPLGPERYTSISLDTKTALIELQPLPGATDLDPAFSKYLRRLYDPATGALSPMYRSNGPCHSIAGHPYVELIDIRPKPGTVKSLFGDTPPPTRKALLGDDLQPPPAFFETRYEALIAVSAAAGGHLHQNPITLSPSAGSWASTGGVILADASGWWHLIDVDGQPITPVIGGLPSIVDPRFLSLHTGSSTVLIDRFGHIVTPHE